MSGDLSDAVEAQNLTPYSTHGLISGRFQAKELS